MLASAAHAICPDGVIRPYTVADGTAWVITPGGSRVSGTVEDGRFKPCAVHHGAHRMWLPPRTNYRR